MKKILVIRFSSLGDVILTSPTVLNLKIAFPDSNITFLTKERFSEVVQRFPGVDRVVTIANNATGRQLLRVLFELENSRFDTIVDLHGSLRSWFARKTISATHRVVYEKRRLERFLSIGRKRLASESPHTIDLYNGCVTQLGARAVANRPVMMLTGEDHRVPKQFDPGEEPYIVIAPGAAHPVKQWPLERFVETAQTLSADSNRKIVWALTEADAAVIGGESAVADQVKLINCPIPYLGAIIERADVLVANDSGIAHLGSAVGTPVVALFGPTHPTLGFSPRGMNDRIVQVDERCRPCSRHGKRSCHRDQRYCFTQITPSTVAETVQAVAESSGRSRAFFVDRDGTIIKEKHFLADPDGVEFEEGAVEALRLIGEMGYKIVILSNQSGVARGKLDIAQVEQVNARLLEMLIGEGVEVDGLYYCPHHRDGVRRHYAIACDCRKPAAGMPEEAARQLGIDLRRSVVVGDKLADLNLGRVIGARSFLVKTGYGAEQFRMLRGSEKEMACENLLAVVKKVELTGLQ